MSVIERSSDETPDAILDCLRDDRGLSVEERDARLNRLVERFPSDRLIAAARSRLRDLSGGDAEAVLRLVEAFGDVALQVELAEAVADQPDLPLERAWEALSLLDAAGLIESDPRLIDRWNELNETLDGDSSIEVLAAQLEEEPDGSWVALQGLGVVEPEVRAEIIAGLADLPGGPGLVAFLRLLVFAHDPATRWAALDALDVRPRDDPAVRLAWQSIAESHPDPGVIRRARANLGATGDGSSLLVSNEAPTLTRSLVTAVDGEGRATIVLAARERGRWACAAFLCHGLRGIVDVVGQDGVGNASLDETFHSLNEQSLCEVLEGRDDLSRRLLAGSLSLCDASTSPALRYWLERTAGPSFRADRGLDLFGAWDPAALAFDETPTRARAVLDACPTWADTSDLTRDLAREIILRGAGPPDPVRDAGAYRYFFEHRLASRIGLYGRMLLWMAAFWQAAGQPELAMSALALAWQLTDAQHAVPSHPFFIALTTTSLERASAAP